MKLKDYLEATGRTQAEFAQAVGSTQGRISQLMNVAGDMPSLKLARAIYFETDGQVGLADYGDEPKAA